MDPTDRPDVAPRLHSPRAPDAEHCDYEGHLWVSAGGGLEICARCDAHQWIDVSPTEPDPYPDSELY